MNTMLINGGFLEEFNHPVIRKIEFYYHNPSIVYFNNGKIKTIDLSCNPYHSQYGIAVSENGDILFQGNWHTKDGLIAYHIMDERILWKKSISHISDIEVHNSVLTVAVRGKSITQLNIHDSSIIQQLQSKSIERMYRLNENLVLVNRFKRNICIFDLESLHIEAFFPELVVNPNQFLSFVIQSAFIDNDCIVITGFEGGGTKMEPKSSIRLQPFTRELGDIAHCLHTE